MVELRVCDQIPWAGGVRKSRYQRLRPLLEHRDVRRIAIPTCTHKGDTTILRDQQFQDRLLQVRSVLSGVAVGDGNGWRIAFRHILPAARKAGRVEMIE